MKIGFTVGVWDLFHEGHINMLTEAKKNCDYLIVGVMTDYWVRVQKGHDRPRQSLETRFLSVLNSNLADKVIILDTLDMTKYLQIADVWILGENQKNMMPFNWPGKQIRIKETENISTTKLISEEQNQQTRTGLFGMSDN
jgi:glycerol-3-phosphate cytidylyltransferase